MCVITKATTNQQQAFVPKVETGRKSGCLRFTKRSNGGIEDNVLGIQGLRAVMADRYGATNARERSVHVRNQYTVRRGRAAARQALESTLVTMRLSGIRLWLGDESMKQHRLTWTPTSR